MNMYHRTGVIRPTLNPGDLLALSTIYGQLAAAALTAQGSVATAVANVTAANEGDTVDGFAAKTSGTQSAGYQLGELNRAAGETATAYNDAAVAIAGGIVAMDAAALQAETLFQQAANVPVCGASIQAQIVTWARSNLHNLEGKAAGEVRQAFANVTLPTPLTITHAEAYGAVSQEVIDAFNALEDPQKRELLQLMADQYADSLGIPRQTIIWDDSMPSNRIGGWGRPDGPLRLNPDFLNRSDAIMLHTIIHEMRHSWQYEMIGEYEEIATDPQRLDDILSGRVPDPMMEQYGISTAEAERMQQRNVDPVRDKGYEPRPVEIGARQAGARGADNLTIQQMEALIAQLG